eukprot:574606-Karenia_brevis.AAC.1
MRIDAPSEPKPLVVAISRMSLSISMVIEPWFSANLKRSLFHEAPKSSITTREMSVSCGCAQIVS